MTKTCPSCGIEVAPEMRFCRRCGMPLRGASADDGSDSVSPIAKTIPLTGEARPTDGLAPEDARRPGGETARVNRAELDELLRPSSGLPSQSLDPNATVAYIDASTPRDEQPPRASTPESFDINSTIAYPIDAQGRPIFPPSAKLEGNSPEDEEDLTVTVPRLETHSSQLPQAPSSQLPETPSSRLPEAPSSQMEATLIDNFTVPPMSEVFPHQQQPSQPSWQRPTPDFSQTMPAPRAASSQQPGYPVSQQQHQPNYAAAHAAQPSPHAAAQPHAQAPKPKAYLWFVAAAGAVFLLLITIVAVWLGVGYFRKSAPEAADAGTSQPAAPDARQQFEEKLNEAQALLASGDLDGAIARLREASALEPSNPQAHRRLGDLLLDSGRRREAIEEFRAAVAADPRDAEGWRALARAQLDESLYAEAVASYRRLVALGGESGLTDNELLSYAEALRLSGSNDEARPLYERLASSSFAEIASAARQKLSELSAPSVSPTPMPSPLTARQTTEQLAQNRTPNASTSPATLQAAPPPAQPQPTPPPAPAPTPPPAQQQADLSAGEHFQRGEQLWSANRAAALNEFRAATRKGNRDAYYYLALSIVEGRNPRSLQRAELVQALQYFQNAKGGRFRSQAQRYEEQLVKEYDRLRNQ
ncbi:MAG TPA: tetratricopeptide repeat protein [Pyrinomonadaceae bacterium]|jgi:tetratricopeptide (TPR) repeat protein